MLLPDRSASIQRRDGSRSQSNCTDSTLLSVLSPPAIVAHLPVLALMSMTSLLTGAAYVAEPEAQNSPRTSAAGAARRAAARRIVDMMSLHLRGQRRDQFPTNCPARWLPRFRRRGCDMAHMRSKV